MLDRARIDPLTGFFLRDALYPFLQNLLIKASLDNKSFSVALIDLDHFKKFNDKFGHDFGDEILKYFSSTLRLSLQENECYIFRYGGDEFIAVIPEKEPKEALRLVRQCGYNLAHRPFLLQNKLYKITASCGIASFPFGGKTIEELIKNADKAMYFSKRHGRNLATSTSSIKYLRLYRTLVLTVGSLVILCSLFILYRATLKQIIQPAISKILGIKNKDVVILKNGAVFEGFIVTETKDKVILNLSPEKGALGYFSGSEKYLVVFNKQEIAKIKYGSKKSRQKNYETP
jgi:diguanylate cyclase (GGDEF)-like protein